MAENCMNCFALPRKRQISSKFPDNKRSYEPDIRDQVLTLQQMANGRNRTCRFSFQQFARINENSCISHCEQICINGVDLKVLRKVSEG